MTSKVFRHIPRAADELLGRVEPDGRVFENRFGPDKLIGRVALDSGKIYETRLGPDKHVGRVEPDTGKVFRARLGPDEYLGRVNQEGQLHRHRPMGADEYIGKINDMASLAHGGAALLLLALPAWQDNQGEGEATAPDETPPAG